MIEGDTAWSPYLSPEEVRKLDTVRLALRHGDIAEAAKYGRVFELTPGGGEVITAAKKPALGLDPRVASGTSEDIVREKRSYAGAFLQPVLARVDGKHKRRIDAAE